MAIQMDDSDSITVSEQSEPSAECWQNMYKLLNFYSLISDPTGILEKSSPENCLSGGKQLPAASQPLISTLLSCLFALLLFELSPSTLFYLNYSIYLWFPFSSFFILSNLSVTSCFLRLFCFVCYLITQFFFFSVGINSYFYHKTDGTICPCPN